MQRKQQPIYVVLLRVAGVYLVCSALLTAIYFPREIDDFKDTSDALLASEKYYDAAYQAGKNNQDPQYVKVAHEEAGRLVLPAMQGFAANLGLADKRLLEVGAGSGTLQDIVPNYTALDISASARRYFHKPFVLASATKMPFADGDFDAIMSVWTLEHIPNPELALREMRRVVKDGGYLILAPAWGCNEFAAHGYGVRPFSDFDWAGKVGKAYAMVRGFGLFEMLHRIPTRIIRDAQVAMAGEPSRLHFKRLQPNFKQYWEPDADAFVSLDKFEMSLWFKSRGDSCLNCDADLRYDLPNTPLIIEVHKPAAIQQKAQR